jgi:uncharacterized membrane protein YgcG
MEISSGAMATRRSKKASAVAAINEVTLNRVVRMVRWSLLAVVVVVLLLIFAIPRRPPPPPSPAQPDQAVIDRVGFVSAAWARQTAGALLNDPRAEIVVYIDTAPEGALAPWTVQASTDWKIGAAKEDTGLVIFIFPDVRIARVEVAYGLEGRFPDARVRQLLEARLIPYFGRGDYEGGLDAFLKAVRDELGGDAGLARAAEAAVKVPAPQWPEMVMSAFQRGPRMISATARNYLEGAPSERIVILVFVAVALGILALDVALAANTIWRLATLPRNWRGSKARAAPFKNADRFSQFCSDIKLVEIVMGVAGFLICFAMIVVVLLFAEDLLTRKGNFGGGGAEMVWPRPAARR